MVLPDHDSASAYIQKYIEAVTVDSSKHRVSSPDSSPPPKKSNVNFDPEGSLTLDAENFPPENLTLPLNHEYEKDGYSQTSHGNRHTIPAEYKSANSQARKISSSSSSSESSSSTNGASLYTSSSVKVHSDKTRAGISPQNSSEIDYEPMLTSPDIPSLEEKLIKSGHYKAPKSHSTFNEHTISLPDAHLSDQISIDTGIANHHYNIHSSITDSKDNLDHRNLSISQKDADHGHIGYDKEENEDYESDLESDADGPTSYEVLRFIKFEIISKYLFVVV